MNDPTTYEPPAEVRVTLTSAGLRAITTSARNQLVDCLPDSGHGLSFSETGEVRSAMTLAIEVLDLILHGIEGGPSS